MSSPVSLLNASFTTDSFSSLSPIETLINGIKTNNLQKVKDALDSNLDIQVAIKEKKILHLACEIGNVILVRLILDQGFLHLRNWEYNETPLHTACNFKRSWVVKELIKYDQKANGLAGVNLVSTKTGLTPLEIAVASDDFASCEFLIEAGADINLKNNQNFSTPLTDACSCGHYEIAEQLLKAKADPNRCMLVTPLYNAVGFPLIVKLLIKNGADVNLKNPLDAKGKYAGLTPLHEAALHGYVGAVEVLLEYNADPKITSVSGQTPLDMVKERLNILRNGSFYSPLNRSNLIKNLKEIMRMLENAANHPPD